MRLVRPASAVLVMSALVTGAALAGGQASVTILSVPREAIAGKSFELAFTVTPDWPMNKNRSLEPTVRAVCGEQVVTLPAVRLKETNRYKTAMALPAEGEWVITVDSRFCHTKMKPLVLKAQAAKRSQT